MNFINNAITTNANNKGEALLFFSLFFISIFFGTAMTLIHISLKQQQGSSASINQMKLKNTSKLADYIIDRSIDSALINFNANKLNVGFVDKSTGSAVFVKNIDPASLNINSQIFSTDPNTNISSLVKAPGVQGNFVINSPNKIEIKKTPQLDTIGYTFSITSSINNIVNGINTFDSSSLNVTKYITCPAPSNGQGSMRALASSELSSLSPPVSSYQFPSLYCTCSDSRFLKTGADGSCSPNVSCTLASLPNCKSCSTTVSNTCAVCNSGYYLSSINTCLACPTTGVASCLNNSMFTCSSGYYRTVNSTSCSLCTSQVGVAACDANTGIPITCQAGYQLVGNSCNPCLPGTYSPTVGTSACISCSSGYYTSTSGQTACNTPCSNLGTGVTSCSTIGVITGCSSGYSLVNGACVKCPADCNSCSSSSVCKSCNTGYYLSGSSCAPCSTGCAACTSSTFCTTCIAGYSYNSSNASCTACRIGTYNTSIGSNYCYTCPNGSYNTKTGESTCYPCSNIGTGVLSCSSIGQIDNCLTGYYLANNSCTLCPTGCKGCSSYTSCSLCDYGYYLSSGACKPCINACFYCTNGTACSVCRSGYYLSSTNTCITCPIGANCPTDGMFNCISPYSYMNSSKTNCIACSSTIGVDTCDSTGLATSCIAGYLLSGGACNSCPSGTYRPTGGSKCFDCYTGYYNDKPAQSSCNIPCSNLGAGVASCSKIGAITQCITGYNLINNSCVTVCPTSCASCTSTTSCTSCNTGYYIDSSKMICIACSSQIGVANCNSSTGSATSCISGYELSSSSCNPCMPGTYNSTLGGTCVNCSSGYYNSTYAQTTCNTPCSNLGTGVASCSTTGTITGCNTGYSLINNDCIKCPNNCTRCSSADSCTLCDTGYYLSGGSCILNTCTKFPGCSPGATCGDFGCYKCLPGYYFYDGCSPAYSDSCFCCPIGCTYCQRPGICMQCYYWYTLINNTCVIN